MNHGAFTKIVPESDTAVLLIHGILGTPNHFADLLSLIPDKWSVCNLLLDGHGAGMADFAATSMKKWKAQVADKLEELLVEHRRVVIVAHSMGTLFAISSAIRQPERIGGLFLLAVPVRPFVSFKATVASVKLMLGIAGKDATVAAMRSDSSVKLERGIWKYAAWTPRVVELLRETALTEKELHRLTVPTVAVQSNRDEMVSTRSAAVLEKNPCIRVVRMPESGHFGYRGRDKAELLTRLKIWVSEMECAE